VLVTLPPLCDAMRRGGSSPQGSDMEQNCRAFAYTQHLGSSGQLPGGTTVLQVRVTK